MSFVSLARIERMMGLGFLGPVRGRRIGLATADRPLEGAPRKDADYGALARRIEKPSKVTLSGANSRLNVCSLARGGCSPICQEFVTLPGRSLIL